eukprot:3055110-Amphidinium_carterae.1
MAFPKSCVNAEVSAQICTSRTILHSSRHLVLSDNGILYSRYRRCAKAGADWCGRQIIVLAEDPTAGVTLVPGSAKAEHSMYALPSKSNKQ